MKWPASQATTCRILSTTSSVTKGHSVPSLVVFLNPFILIITVAFTIPKIHCSAFNKLGLGYACKSIYLSPLLNNTTNSFYCNEVRKATWGFLFSQQVSWFLLPLLCYNVLYLLSVVLVPLLIPWPGVLASLSKQGFPSHSSICCNFCSFAGAETNISILGRWWHMKDALQLQGFITLTLLCPLIRAKGHMVLFKWKGKVPPPISRIPAHSLLVFNCLILTSHTISFITLIPASKLCILPISLSILFNTSMALFRGWVSDIGWCIYSEQLAKGLWYYNG